MRSLLLFVLIGAAACGGGSEAPTSSGTPGGPGAAGVATVTVSPSSADIHVDDTLSLSAVAKTAAGTPLSGKTVAWATSAPSVVAVSSSGFATALAQGTATVSATVDGITGAATITVSAARVVATIRLSYPSATIARGQALELTPTLHDSAGAIIPRRVVAWASGDPSIVQADSSGATGKLTARLAGTTTITATVDGVSAKANVSVLAFASIAAGPQFSCALTVDGRLYCAGGSYGLFATPLAPNLKFNSVTSDGLGPDFHACGLTVDGAAYCWGSNNNGELGTGDSIAHAEPARVAGALTFSNISAGRYHTCGVTTQGEPYCWGSGSEGRLGTGDTTSHSSPVLVSRDLRFRQIQAGANATCGVATGGQAYCWGRNDLGQLGSRDVPGGNLGDFTPNPVPVSGAIATTQIVTKGPRSCLLDQTKRAFCFGNNTVFELGTTTSEQCYGNKPCSRTPVAVQTSETFVLISTSTFATCGLTATKTMLCWGLDYQFIFGAPGTVPRCPIAGATYGCTASPISGPSGFITLTSAEATQCGIREDGIAYCWGGNDNGQRGTPGASPDPTPRVFSLSPNGTP